MFIVGVGALTLVVVRLHQMNDLRDLSLSGYLALILVVTSVLAWIGHLQNPASTLLLLPVCGPIFFARGQLLIGDIVSGKLPVVANALLAASIAALAGLWWRMAVMHEEMAEYGRILSPGFRLKVRMTGDPVFRRENAAGTTRLEAFVRNARRLDKPMHVADAGFWERVRHWRMVIGSGRTPLLVAVVLGVWTLAMPAIFNARRGELVAFPLAMAIFVPGLIVAGVWPRRWYMLASESLRPVSRRRFILEQGAAMALELAATAAAITAAVFAAGLLLDTRDRWASPLWLALPLVAAGQVLTFGVLVWVLRYRSSWLVVVPMLLVALIDTIVMVATFALIEHRDVHNILMFAAGFAVAGVVLTADAYRRWLTTEFD
jgi:hypothetical protein